MRGRRVGSSFVATTAAALLAVIALPGAAQARTDSDQRCQGPDKQFIVCTELTRVDSERTASIGGPTNPEFHPKTPLPANEPQQCQPAATQQTPEGTGYVAGNTQAAPGYGVPYWNGDFSWAWQWDFYVDGGYWVVWDGSMPGQWPYDFTLPNGDIGLVSLAASVHNWHPSRDIDARMFWICVPANQALFNSGGGATAAAGMAPTGVHRDGDAGDDKLRGDGARNALVGRAGDDRLSGGDGEDHLQAGTGDDTLLAGDHADLLHGRSGDDRALGGGGGDDILTGKGDDLSHGGNGDDQLFDDQGRDHLRGGRGNDRFAAQDGDRDRIDCGPGEDIALIDKKDLAIGCEHVYRTAREVPKRLPRI